MIVIGGGILGLSLSVELLKRDIRELTLIEAKTLGSGSTLMSGGMIRGFHKNSSLSKLAIESLEHFSSSPGFRKNGALSIIPKELYQYALEQQQEFSSKSYHCEILSAEQVKNCFDLNIEKEQVGFFEPAAGSIDPDFHMQYLKDTFDDLGGEVLENTKVEELLMFGGKISGVKTSNQEINSDHIVLASGYQGAAFLKRMGIEAGKVREVISYTATTPKKITTVPNIFDYSNRFYLGRISKDSLVIGMADHPEPKFVSGQFEKLTGIKIELSTQRSAKELYFPEQSGISNSICGWRGLYAHMGWGGGAFKFSHSLAKQAAEKIKEELQKERVLSEGVSNHETKIGYYRSGT